MLCVDIHQFQLKFSNALIFLTLESEADDATFTLVTKSDTVIVTRALQDFSHTKNINKNQFIITEIYALLKKTTYLFKLIPMLTFLSQRYVSKPSLLNKTCTRAT